MAVVRYEPWNVLQRFSNDLGRLYDTPTGARWDERDSSSVDTSHWTPAVDIKEEPDRFVLDADVPGVEPKDIDITMEEGLLVIKGVRANEEVSEANGYKRIERPRGSFYRRFSLPDIADVEQIKAEGKNGVLTITIPKQEKVRPRKIPVS